VKNFFFGLAVGAAAIGCSGSSSSDATGDSGVGASHDSSSSSETSSDVATDTNGAEKSGDSAIADAPPIDGVSFDASDAGDGGDPMAPHPPADASPCGEGTFTAGDASTACMKPSFALDDMPLPDGGFGSTPRACGALTTSGGSWKVWCGPSATYVWARFDDVVNDGALKDCHGGSLLMIDEGVYDTGSSGGNSAHVRTFQDPYGEIAGTPEGVTQTAIVELTLDGTWPTGDGGANLFVLGSLEDSCAGGAPQPPTVLTGTSVTWKAP
jgi:hypothetical protein